jgi:uncharacterized protein
VSFLTAKLLTAELTTAKLITAKLITAKLITAKLITAKLLAVSWWCLLAVAGAAHAAAPQAIPEATSLLVDQAHALSDDERAALEQRLKTIQDSGRAQVGMLVSSGTGGEPLSDYSLRVAEKWQLGRAGRDDGLLIVVVPSAGAARIEVGYGLEGSIPDARASRWLDDLLPAVKGNELAKGLNQLLDQIEDALPEGAKPAERTTLFDDHPEWRVPFVLVIFSAFALFPLFFGRWGCVASGPMLAAMIGAAAWVLWDSQNAGIAAAACALPLPFLWALNWSDDERLAPWLLYGKRFGNFVAVAWFFFVVTLFVGVGLSVAEAGVIWIAPVFAGFLSTGMAVMLFPGKPARYLSLVLRSMMHFVFVLTVAWTTLLPFMRDPSGVALAVAGAVTALAALGLYLDSRGRKGVARWCFVLAILVALPFGLLALVLSFMGEDLAVQIAQGTAGGGSVLGALSLAARRGLLAAAKVGLGGRFGGGGAGRQG